MKRVKKRGLEQSGSSKWTENGIKQIKWWIFLIPILAAMLVLMLYPVLESFRLSFFKSNGISETFRGLDNYKIVLSDGLFWKSMWNTVLMGALTVCINIPLSFVIACAINSLRRGKNLTKCMFFIAYITPGVAASTIFLYVFHPEGLLNLFLSFFGVPAITWLQTPFTAHWAVVLYSIWKGMGFNIILFIANLQTISQEYYEAAYIDGCTPLKAWWHITIPNMKPTIALLTIMGWIQSLQRFQETYTLGTNTGSPERSLFTMVMYIYDRGFGSYEFGVAAAAAWILFLLIAGFTLVNKRISKLEL